MADQTVLDEIAGERRPWVIINLNEDRWWGECPMCGAHRRLGRAVGWYEEPRQEDIGTVLPHGGEVGGMSVCVPCHDRWYGLDRAAQEATDAHP